MIWLWGSVIVLEFGPYDYPILNRPVFYLYVTAAHFALLFGYLTANRNGAPYVGKWRPQSILAVSLMVTIFVVLLTLLLGAERSLDVRAALEDPGIAYDRYVSSQGAGLLPYLLILLEPIALPFRILVPFYWRSLSGFVRFIFVLVTLVSVVEAVGSAVRGAIVFQMILIGCGFLAAYYGGRLVLRVASRFRVAVLAGAALFALLAYFSFIYSERAGDMSVTFNSPIQAFPDPDHWLVRITPESQQPLVMGGIIYLTHGYYGLSLALDKPFVGIGFGLTSSMFVQRNFERLTGSTVLSDYSYANRLTVEDLYPVGNYWMTIYPWIASDVTFVGSLIVLFLIGRCFALSWTDAVQYGNPAAVIVFALIAHLIYAFPMNNPLQDGSAFTRAVFWLLFWLFTRERITWKSQQMEREGPAPHHRSRRSESRAL